MIGKQEIDESVVAAAAWFLLCCKARLAHTAATSTWRTTPGHEVGPRPVERSPCSTPSFLAMSNRMSPCFTVYLGHTPYSAGSVRRKHERCTSTQRSATAVNRLGRRQPAGWVRGPAPRPCLTVFDGVCFDAGSTGGVQRREGHEQAQPTRSHDVCRFEPASSSPRSKAHHRNSVRP